MFHFIVPKAFEGSNFLYCFVVDVIVACAMLYEADGDLGERIFTKKYKEAKIILHTGNRHKIFHFEKRFEVIYCKSLPRFEGNSTTDRYYKVSVLWHSRQNIS